MLPPAPCHDMLALTLPDARGCATSCGARPTAAATLPAPVAAQSASAPLPTGVRRALLAPWLTLSSQEGVTTP